MRRRAETTEELTGVSTAFGPAAAVEDERVVRERPPRIGEQCVGARAVCLARAPAVGVWAQPFAELRVLEHPLERRAQVGGHVGAERLGPDRLDAGEDLREPLLRLVPLRREPRACGCGRRALS